MAFRGLTRVAAVARAQVRSRAGTAAAAPIAESEVSALLKKAEGPWGQMSATEKTNLYRAVYKNTRAEMQATEGSDSMTVFIGVIASLGAAWLFHQGTMKAFIEKPPATMDKEWKDAEHAKQSQRGQNPVFGGGYGGSR